jgi:dTDP-4-dehydrorhamnose reductase
VAIIHVVGERGQLGRCLVERGCTPYGEANLSKGDVVINCAAKTDHNYCNQNPEEAWASNVDLVKELASECFHAEAFLIHISTDYVFSHSWSYPEDKPQPVPGNVYANTKFIAEEYLKMIKFDDWAIVRTSWLLSPYKKAEWLSLPNAWAQIGSPTWAPNFAEALINLKPKKRKIYHFAGRPTARSEVASLFQGKQVGYTLVPHDRPTAPILASHFDWSPRPLTPLEVVDAYKKAHDG